jgi:hypothetical protein
VAPNSEAADFGDPRFEKVVKEAKKPVALK